MPKRKPPPQTTDYESDNGFIVADDDGEGGGGAPASKRTKKGAAKDGGRGGGKKEKGGKGDMGVGKKGRGKDGGEFWELTSKRRVGISEFKGKYMVNIREYYEKDGEVLPGKKGISLPIEQFNTLIKVLPEIEIALAEKNQSVSRPDYSGAGVSAAVEEGEEEEEDEEMERGGKKNFEETSDEE